MITFDRDGDTIIVRDEAGAEIRRLETNVAKSLGGDDEKLQGLVDSARQLLAYAADLAEKRRVGYLNMVPVAQQQKQELESRGIQVSSERLDRLHRRAELNRDKAARLGAIVEELGTFNR